MSEEKSKIDLVKEIALLKQEIKRLKEKRDDTHSDYDWAKIFDQEEIDYFVQLKISKEMMEYYIAYDLTSIRVIENVLDFVLKGQKVDDMPSVLEDSLSLGLITTDALEGAILSFLEMVNEVGEIETGFLLGDDA